MVTVVVIGHIYVQRYAIQVLRFSPWLLGYPCRRPRKYTVLVRRDAYAWQGSSDEFEAIFAKKVAAPASVYFCTPSEEIEAQVMETASVKGKVPQDGSRPKPVDLLTPPQKRRVAVANSQSHELNQHIFADVGQEPDRTVSGPFLPPVLCGSAIYSTEQGRLATSMELAAVQGIPLFRFLDAGGDEESTKWQQLGISPNQLKILAGNAMHRPSIGCVILYALSRALPIRHCMHFRNMGSCLLDEREEDEIE